MQDRRPGATAPLKDENPEAETPDRRVLIVEDESLTAMMMEDALSQSGYEVCGTAATEAEALRLADQAWPSFAIVDIALGDTRAGLEVGRVLASRGASVLYATAFGVGYRQEMEDMGGRGVLQKPFSAEDVPLALETLERLRRGQAPERVPPSFHLFVD